MQTYVRAHRCHDPARRPRRVLRIGRATRQPPPARSAGDRGRWCGDGGQLRGTRVRGADRDGSRPGPPVVPARGRGRSSDDGLRRGQPSGVRGVRRHHAVRRRALDRRGVPRRRWSPPGGGLAHGDRGAATRPGVRPGRLAHHRRSRPDQVPRQGGERRRQAGWAARRRARRRDRVPVPAAGRAAVGRWAGDGRQAARARHRHRRGGGTTRGGVAGHDARTRGGAEAVRVGAPPRSASGAGRTAATIHGCAASARPIGACGGRGRRHPRRSGRRDRTPAPGRAPGRANSGAPAAFRRLLSRDPVTHAAAGDGGDAPDPRRRASCWRRRGR